MTISPTLSSIVIIDSVQSKRKVQNQQKELPMEVDVANVSMEDVSLLLAEGFDVDDDNQPAPENIPTAGEMTTGMQQRWGWNGICNRKAAGIQNPPAMMNNATESDIKSMTLLSMFLWLFSNDFPHKVLFKKLNVNLQQQKEREVRLGELLRFLGIWFYIATFKGFTRQQFWSFKNIDEFDGATVRLHN
jgi:hypothetical protein